MKKTLKSEKGAITLVVLIGMLFLTTFLMSMHINIANKARISAETTNRIAEMYNNLDEATDMLPIIFDAHIEKTTVVMDREGATVTIKVKNNENDLVYNSYPVNYEISVEQNNKFNVATEENLNSKAYKTIAGGNPITEEITIRINAIDVATLEPQETVKLKIQAFSPYTKTIIIPITINTNPSTMSGIELNFLIKNGSYAPEGDVYEYYSVDANRMQDYTIKKIVFGKYSDYKNEVSGIKEEPIDVNRIGIINLYRVLNNDKTTYTIYILSDDGKFVLSENAAWTFDKLYALESIENLHLLNTSQVTNMRDMFCDCAALTNVDVSNFDTSKVTDMIGMFARMEKIEFLDLLSFDTQSITKMGQMFTTCPLLKAIYVSDKWKLASSIEGAGMFTSCTNLVGGNGTVLDSTVDFSRAVIDGTTKGYLTGVYNFIDGLNVNHAIKAKTSAEIKDWTLNTRFTDTSVTSITLGRTKDYYDIVKDYNGSAVDAQKSGAIKCYRIPNGNGTYSVYILSNSGKLIANSDSSWMFDKLYKLQTIHNLNLLDTSKVVNMRDLFCDCESITSLDLSGFNTTNVQSLQGTFARMYSIEEIDLSSFNTKNVTTMLNMFALSISSTETLEEYKNAIPKLKTIYVSNLWSTNKITTTTEAVFANTVNLVGGGGTKFNSSNTLVNYARIDTPSTPGYLTLKY